MKKYILWSLVGIFGILWVGNSYYFGLKSSDDSVENIQLIESQLGIGLPIVSFIFDPWEQYNVPGMIDTIAQKLWTNRIYHITISPNMYSAQEVADGFFDAQYLQFFRKVKENNLRVIFRTMHEMNGGRYPRWSNPESFKQAWIHVWELSRTAGLDQNNILFDFSVNHRDMPTKGKPSQTAILYQCKPGKIWDKSGAGHVQRKNCPRFEDYYPWDYYVDIVGFSFYNWGKASSNRLWLSPEEILNDPEWRTLERVQALWKPLFIDEVATTTVWYAEGYNFDRSREEYLNHSERKEAWLEQLKNFLEQHSEILWAVYFNTDYTAWLSFKVIWEADRSIVDLQTPRIYQWFYSLYQASQHNLRGILGYFHNSQLLELNGKEIIINQDIIKEVSLINGMISKKTELREEQITLVEKLIWLGIKDQKIQQSLAAIQESYK